MAIWIIDREGRILEVNDVACERLGYTREELLGMTVMDIDAPEFAALVKHRIREVLLTGAGVFETAHVAARRHVLFPSR